MQDRPDTSTILLASIAISLAVFTVPGILRWLFRKARAWRTWKFLGWTFAAVITFGLGLWAVLEAIQSIRGILLLILIVLVYIAAKLG